MSYFYPAPIQRELDRSYQADWSFSTRTTPTTYAIRRAVRENKAAQEERQQRLKEKQVSFMNAASNHLLLFVCFSLPPLVLLIAGFHSKSIFTFQSIYQACHYSLSLFNLFLHLFILSMVLFILMRSWYY